MTHRYALVFFSQIPVNPQWVPFSRTKGLPSTRALDPIRNSHFKEQCCRPLIFLISPCMVSPRAPTYSEKTKSRRNFLFPVSCDPIPIFLLETGFNSGIEPGGYNLGVFPVLNIAGKWTSPLCPWLRMIGGNHDVSPYSLTLTEHR